jgi:hypothetical protein
LYSKLIYTMKHFLLGFLCLLATSCFLNIEPEVASVKVPPGEAQAERAVAVSFLYNHLLHASQDKSFYEVLSNREGRYILNYNRTDQRLTLCTDPGSGWGTQYMHLSVQDLEEMVEKGITLDDLDHRQDAVRLNDSTLLIKQKPFYPATSPQFIRPKTKGKPSGF